VAVAVAEKTAQVHQIQMMLILLAKMVDLLAEAAEVLMLTPVELEILHRSHPPKAVMVELGKG